MPHPQEIEDNAARLYAVYCHAVGGKAYDGRPLPAWAEFSADPGKQTQANGWRALGEIVAMNVADAETSRRGTALSFQAKICEKDRRVAELEEERMRHYERFNRICEWFRGLVLPEERIKEFWSLIANGKRSPRDQDGYGGALNAAQKRIAELEAALKLARSHVISHHAAHLNGGDLGWCPVCHKEDGTEPEMDLIDSALNGGAK